MPRSTFLFRTIAILFTLGLEMSAHAGEVVYGVPFGTPRGCGARLLRAGGRGSRTAAERDRIFEALNGAVRSARATAIEVDAYGAHTWHLAGARPVTVSILRGPGHHFDVMVESPEFERNFVVTDSERRRALLAGLVAGGASRKIPRVHAEPRRRSFVGAIML